MKQQNSYRQENHRVNHDRICNSTTFGKRTLKGIILEKKKKKITKQKCKLTWNCDCKRNTAFFLFNEIRESGSHNSLYKDRSHTEKVRKFIWL